MKFELDDYNRNITESQLIEDLVVVANVMPGSDEVNKRGDLITQK